MVDKKDKYIIVTHKLFPGAGQDLYKYFKNRGIPVLLIEHNFLTQPNRRTIFSYFDGQKENKKVGLNYRFFRDIICYIKDFIYTLYAAILYPYKYQVYFGCGGFNVIAGLILKLFKRVDKVVFYTIDFMPARFNNRTLDKLYLAIDKFSVKYADQTWNVCTRMVEGREKYNNMPPVKFNRQKTVPIGVWLENSSDSMSRMIKNKTLVFSGHLQNHFGVQLVLEAIPEIIKKVPDFKFLIIGEGENKNDLINLARSIGIDKFIEFRGPIYDQEVLAQELSSCRAGIATYLEEGNLRIYFADSTKPKLYLACGLPLIITKIAWIHEEVEKRKMGIVINYDKQQLTDAVVKLMTDDGLYLSCKRNAENFILGLDWNNIFDKALEELKNA